MEFVLDVHTHTIASGHAYSTTMEMIQAAKEKNLKLLGISEHAPQMPGTCHEFYFANFKVFPRKVDGVQLMFGVEANIVDSSGKIDMSEEMMKKLDYGIASLHIPCFTPGSSRENTAAYVRVMENPNIQIIGHPDDSRYPIDYKELVKVAKNTGTLLEVNNTSLSPVSPRKNAKDNYKYMLDLCAEADVPIIINSDAHVSFDVGGFEYAKKLLEEIHFPRELIANTSVDKFNEFIRKKKEWRK